MIDQWSFFSNATKNVILITTRVTSSYKGREDNNTSLDPLLSSKFTSKGFYKKEHSFSQWSGQISLFFIQWTWHEVKLRQAISMSQPTKIDRQAGRHNHCTDTHSGQTPRTRISTKNATRWINQSINQSRRNGRQISLISFFLFHFSGSSTVSPSKWTDHLILRTTARITTKISKHWHWLYFQSLTNIRR